MYHSPEYLTTQPKQTDSSPVFYSEKIEFIGQNGYLKNKFSYFSFVVLCLGITVLLLKVQGIMANLQQERPKSKCSTSNIRYIL